MPIKQEEVIISDETNHGNSLAQQGIPRVVTTLLLQPWWRKLVEIVYLLFCISGFGRTFRRMQQNASMGCTLRDVKYSPYLKIKELGIFSCQQSLPIEKNNLARIAEISHLRVIWWLGGETRFGSSHILLSKFCCLGKSRVPEALAGEYLGCFMLIWFRAIACLSRCLESY